MNKQTNGHRPKDSEAKTQSRRKNLWFILGILIVVGACGWLLFSSQQVQDWLMDKGLENIQKPRHTDLLDRKALRVVLCGTGTPTHSPKRANACTAVFAGGHFFLFDIGPGAWRNIGLWRLPIPKLKAVFFTHFHSDHIGGLGEATIQSWAAGRQEPLLVYGTEGIQKIVKGFEQAYQPDVEYRSRYNSSAMSRQGSKAIAKAFTRPHPEQFQKVWDQNGVRITAFAVQHSASAAVGYRVDYGGRSVVISGDTTKVKAIVSAAKNADLLVHEALAAHMLQRYYKSIAHKHTNKREAKLLKDVIADHITPVQAAELANQAGTKLLIYTHVVPPPDNVLLRRIFLRGVSQIRPKGVVIGEDGDMFTLPAKQSTIKHSRLR